MYAEYAIILWLGAHSARHTMFAAYTASLLCERRCPWLLSSDKQAMQLLYPHIPQFVFRKAARKMRHTTTSSAGSG